MAKISKFILFYLVQAACLWIGVQASIYFQGDALKIFLQDYWLFFYAIPLVTTGFIFHEIKDIPLSALIGWTDRQCLVVYSEGKKSWQYNQVTYFLRRRWLLYLFVSSLVVFFVLHAIFFFVLPAALQSVIILASGFLFFGINIFALRKRTVRMLDLQASLHQLAHQLRNEHSHLLKKFTSKEKVSSEDSLRYLTEALDRSREYLRILTAEKSIELAIRLALPHQEQQGNIIYHPLVRTNGLQEEAWLSTSIPANEGIPRYLIEERDACNVLVYRDMKKALGEKLFWETEDDSFAERVGSLAVSPLKAWDGKKKSMVGILYLSSGRKKTFCEEHIDGIRFIADILSDALASSVTVNHMLIMKGNKNARRRQLLEKY